MIYTHTTGTQVKIKTDPEFNISIRITRGKTIVNRKTGRNRIIDRSINAMARDPNDISMELEFMHDGELWRVDPDTVEVIV